MGIVEKIIRIFLFELGTLKKYFIEYFVLMSLLFLSLYFSISNKFIQFFLNYLLINILSLFFICLLIFQTINEKEKTHIYRFLKCLPLNNFTLYFSQILTFWLFYIIINIIPCSFLTLFYKKEITLNLAFKNVSFNELIFCYQIGLYAFCLFFITSYLIIFILNLKKIKSTLYYILFFCIFLFLASDKLTLNIDEKIIKSILFDPFFKQTINIFIILAPVLIYLMVYYCYKYFNHKKIYQEL